MWQNGFTKLADIFLRKPLGTLNLKKKPFQAFLKFRGQRRTFKLVIIIITNINKELPIGLSLNRTPGPLMTS